MSGIAGLYYPDGRPVDGSDLRRMVDILAHRGPDRGALWCQGAVGLGHRMLHTTPESLHETLPLVDQTSDLVLTADARIDNREELIALLDLPQSRQRPVTDSELILTAYEKWGTACPEKLIGDFAFALWDSREQHLFCARDQLGVKPFYYHYHPGRAFYFASEIKAFMCLEELSLTMNESRVADFLDVLFEDKENTSYNQVKRLPAAHAMTVHPNGARITKYWELDPEKEIRYASQEQYDEAFRERFREAVRCRLRSAFQIGSQLSGGLDSTAVSCVARDLLAPSGRLPLKTFSNIFDEVPECDEREYIRHVLAQGGFDPVYINADQTGPLTDWDAASAHEDEAFTTANYYLVWGLLRAAQVNGTRIVLDGFDGDTTVSHGWHYFDELAIAGDWSAFFGEAKAVAERFEVDPKNILRQYGLGYIEDYAKQGKGVRFIKAVNEVSKLFDISKRSLLARHGLKPILPGPLLAGLRRLRRPGHTRIAVVNQGNTLLIINKAFAERLGRKERRAKDGALETRSPATLRADQCEVLQSGGFAYVLELYDRVAAAFGVEVRHPFLDRRLIEFCVALPPEQKLHSGWPRWILRSAFKEIMPPEICWRTGKANMEPNHQRAVITFDKDRFEALLSSELQEIKPYVDLDVVRTAWDRITTGSQYYPKDLNAVWRALCLLLWLRRIEAFKRERSASSSSGEGGT